MEGQMGYLAVSTIIKEKYLWKPIYVMTVRSKFPSGMKWRWFPFILSHLALVKKLYGMGKTRIELDRLRGSSGYHWRPNHG